MARPTSGGRTMPGGVKFTCTVTHRDWVTDGGEPIVDFEEQSVIGGQSDSTSGMKCPDCPNGYIKLGAGYGGPKGTHHISVD